MVAPGPNFSASVRVKKDGWYSVYRERRLAKGRTPQLLPHTFRPRCSIEMRCHPSQKPGPLVRRRVPKSGVHALSLPVPGRRRHRTRKLTEIPMGYNLVNALPNDLCVGRKDGTRHFFGFDLPVSCSRLPCNSSTHAAARRKRLSPP